jgi:hypothetical protein
MTKIQSQLSLSQNSYNKFMGQAAFVILEDMSNNAQKRDIGTRLRYAALREAKSGR